jgi:hypothetical protein
MMSLRKIEMTVAIPAPPTPARGSGNNELVHAACDAAEETAEIEDDICERRFSPEGIGEFAITRLKGGQCGKVPEFC